MTMKLRLLTLILVLALVVLAGASVAQETTPEPTADVTVEPTSDVTAEPTSDVTAEPTSEVTPPVEGTSEVTPEVTLEVTTEVTSEATSAVTPPVTIVTTTPLPPATIVFPPPPDRVVINHAGLFPEGVEWDARNRRFLVGSVTEGTIYSVADDGTLTPFIEDDRIVSSVGLEIDETNNRLLVAITDQETAAYLGVYDLNSGANLAFVDFAPLLPDATGRFANDVAVDNFGNAYVPDSLAGAIYQVASQTWIPSVQLQDASFAQPFTLNGIAYNETGDYLVAARNPGLVKIMPDNPGAFTPVTINGRDEIPGIDGVLFVDATTLVIVSNQAGRVYRLESSDNFATADVTGIFETGPVFPTTAALREGEVFVLYAHLDQRETNPDTAEFVIQRVDFDTQNLDRP